MSIHEAAKSASLGASFTGTLANGGQFSLSQGGYYALVVIASAFGSFQLQVLAGDNATWVNVGAAVVANGFSVLQLPPGSYRWTTAAATTALFAELVRIPVG